MGLLNPGQNSGFQLESVPSPLLTKGKASTTGEEESHPLHTLQAARLPAQPTTEPKGEATTTHPKPSSTVALPTIKSQKVLGRVLTKTQALQTPPLNA